MSDTKFTPSPWIVLDKRKDGSTVNNIVRMDGAARRNKYDAVPYVAIGGFYNHDQDDGVAEIEANAHLISAAPNLYKSLEDMLIDNEEEMDYWFGTDLMDQVRSAMKKARGES